MLEKNNNEMSFVELMLKQVIKNVPRLTECEREQLASLFLAEGKLINKSSGDVLIHAGQTAGCFFICLQGLLRNYYLLESGKTFNKSFISAPGVAGSLSEYISGQASRFSIECLEDVTLIAVDFELLRAEESKVFVQKFYLHIVEMLALIKEKREASLLIDDAKTRLIDFYDNNSHIINRVPDYHIASHIGITPVAFSRLKKSIINLG